MVRFFYAKSKSSAAKNWKRKLLSVVGVGLGLFGSSNAQGQTSYTWNVPGNGNWDTATQNWLSGGIAAAYTSAAGNVVTFGNTLTASSTITATPASLSVGEMFFTDTGSLAYTIAGSSNTLTLDNSGVSTTAQINIGHGTVSNNTISNSVLTVGGTSSTGLAITNNGAYGFNSLTISSATINGSTGAITYSGQGSTTISGALGASFTGGLTFSSGTTGTLTLSNTADAFAGTITINSGVLVNGSTTTDVLTTAANAFSFPAGSTGVVRYSGSFTTAVHTFTLANATSTVDFDLTSGATIINAGTVTGAGAILITSTGGTGASTMEFNKNNSGFTGTLTVGGPEQIIGGAVSMLMGGPTYGASVLIAGANGKMAAASSGAVTIDNGAALGITQPAAQVTGRLGTRAIVLNGGRFVYTNNASNTAFADTFGALTVTGLGVITGSATASAASTSITFSSITVKNASGDYGSVFFRSTSASPGIIGGAAGAGIQNYFFTGLAASSGTAGSPTLGIIPWAANVTTLTGSNAANLMTYDSNGIRPLAASEVVTATTSLTAGQNNSLAGNIANSTSFAVNSIINSTTTSYSITGTGTITVNGGGTLGGALTGTGGITFNGPTLDFGTGTGYLHLGSAFAITGTSNITGSAGVVVSGLGTAATPALTLSNTTASTFTGGLVLDGSGQVYFSADNQLGATTSSVVLGGGQLLYNGTSSSSLSSTRGIRVGVAGGTIGSTVAGVTLTLPETISGPGQIQFGGGITSNATGVVALTSSSANTYTGGTLISTGILNITNPNQLGTGSILLNGGTLQAGGNLSFSVTPALVASSTFDTQTNSIALTGGVNGVSTATVLTKVGSGTLTISGAGNYNGSIAVNAGALTINGNGALNELGGITLANSTTLNIDNSVTNLTTRTGRATNLTAVTSGTVAGGATINLTTNSAGSTYEFGALTVSGGLAGFANTSTLNIIDGGSGHNSITFLSLATSANNLLDVVGTTNLGNGSATTGTHIFFQTAPTASQLSYVTFTGFGGSGTPVYSTNLGLSLPPVVNGSIIDNIGTYSGNTSGTTVPTTAAFVTNAATTAYLGATLTSLSMSSTVTLVPSIYSAVSGNANAPSNSLVLSSGGLTSTASSTITSASAAVVLFGSSGTNTASISLSGGDLTFDTQVTPTTTGGLSTSGTGNLFINGPNAITGLYTIGNSANVTLNTAATAAGLAGSTGNLVVNAPLTINGTASSTYSGTISGASTISTPAAYTGTQILSGSNSSYTGTITINGGTLAAGNANAFGPSTNSAITVNSGGTVSLTGGIALNPIPMILNGTGSATSAGALDNLSGINTYSGAISLGSATQIGATAGTLNLGGPITTNSGGLTFNPIGTINSSGGIGGTGSIIMSGTGTLGLSGTTSTYTGSTSLYTGTILLGSSNPIPAASPLIIGTAAGSSGMKLNLNGFNQTVPSITINAPTANTTVIAIGTGTLTVNGNISLNDNTSEPGETFSTATFSSSATGLLDLGGQVRTITVHGQDGGTSDLIMDVVVQNGGINFTGIPSSTLATATGLTLGGTAANTYTLGTTVNEGTLTVAAATTIGSGPLVINQTGTITSKVTLSGSNSFSSLSSGTVSTAADVLLAIAGVETINQSTNTTFVGVISGAGSLVMNGTGTLTLTGSNTFTGAVTVANGTIAVNTLAAPGTASGLGKAAATVSFTLGGSSGTTGLIAYNGTSAFTYNRLFTLAAGGSGGFAGSGTLTASNVISGSGNFVYSGTGSATLSATNTFTGNVSVSSGLLTLTGANSFTGNINITGGAMTISGASGTANSSGNVSISGGGLLTLDNTAASVQRLNTTTPANITLNLGQMNVIANATTNLSNNESLGILSVTGGSNSNNNLTLTNSSTSSPLQITFSSLNISTGAAILIRGDNLGSSTAANYTRVLFTTAPASPGTEIPGVYFGGTSSSNGIGPAAYDPTYGIIQFVTPVASGNVLDNINGPMVPTSASFSTGGTGTTLAVNAGATVNDLTIQSGFSTVQFSNMYLSGTSGNASAPAGTLVISSGLFQVLSSSASTVTIFGDVGGSTLQAPAAWTFNLSNNLVLDTSMTVVGGGLAMMGTGNLTINGTNNITGNYNLSGGNLTIAGATTASAITVNGASVLTIGGTTTATSLTLNGTSTAAFTGAATFTGAISLAGTANALTLSAGGSASSLSVASGGSVVLGGLLSLTGSASNTIAGPISGTNGALSMSAGTLTLSVANTFGGGLTATGGTISTSLGAGVGTGVLTLSGAVLSYTGTVASDTLTASSVYLGTGGGTITTSTSTTNLTVGAINGPGNLSKTGTGAITLSSTNTYNGTTGTPVYTGSTIITTKGSTIVLGANNALQIGTNLTITPAGSGAGFVTGLNIGSFNQTIGSLNLTLSTGTPATGTTVITGTTGVLTLGGTVTVGPVSSSDYPVKVASLVDLGGATRTFTTGSGGNSGSFEGDLQFTNVISGSNGAGVIINNSSTAGIVTFAAANTYTGSTTLTSGIIYLLANNAIPSTSAFIQSAGTTLDLSGGDVVTTISTGVGSITGTGSIILGSTSSSFLTIGGDNTSPAAYSGTISTEGTDGGITKVGTGTLTLTGSNSFTGPVTIANGTISVPSLAAPGTASPLGEAASTVAFTLGGSGTTGILAYTGTSFTYARLFTLAAGGTGGFAGTGPLTLSGVISGSGNLQYSGSSTLTLTGVNTFTGSVIIASGTIAVSSLSAPGTSGTLGAAPSTVAFILGGTGTTGTLAYNGTSTTPYARNFTLATGGSGSFSGTGSPTISGSIGGSGNLIYSGGTSGTSTLTLTGTNTYTGTTTINAGTLAVGTGGSLASATAVIENQAGSVLTNFTIASSQTIAGLSTGTVATSADATVTINNAGTILTINQTSNSTYAGIVKGVGGIAMTGTGILSLTGANIYTGSTTLSSGTMYILGNNAFPSTSALVQSAGTTLDLTGGGAASNISTGVGSLTGAGSIVLGSNSTLTVGADNTSPAAYSGVISGAGGSVAKVGTGITTLTGTNTYTGTTTITNGTLAIGTGGSLAAGSAVSVNGGSLSGTGTVNGSVTVNSGATISAGNPGAVGTLTLNGPLTISAGATMGVTMVDGTTPSSTPGGSTIGSLPNPTSNNFLNVTNSNASINAGALITINGTGVTFASSSNYSYEIGNVAGLNLSILSITTQSQFTTIGFTASNFSLTGDSSGDMFVNFTTPVPEPSTVALIGAAGIGLLGTLRRRQVKPLMA